MRITKLLDSAFSAEKFNEKDFKKILEKEGVDGGKGWLDCRSHVSSCQTVWYLENDDDGDGVGDDDHGGDDGNDGDDGDDGYDGGDGGNDQQMVLVFTWGSCIAKPHWERLGRFSFLIKHL